MSDAKVRVIIKRPDEKIGHVTNISPTLKNLQRTVGGKIETVTLVIMPDGGMIHIICNEEGRLQNLPHNCQINGVDYVGDIICAQSNADGDLIDLQISYDIWKDILRNE